MSIVYATITIVLFHIPRRARDEQRFHHFRRQLSACLFSSYSLKLLPAPSSSAASAPAAVSPPLFLSYIFIAFFKQLLWISPAAAVAGKDSNCLSLSPSLCPSVCPSVCSSVKRTVNVCACQGFQPISSRILYWFKSVHAAPSKPAHGNCPGCLWSRVWSWSCHWSWIWNWSSLHYGCRRRRLDLKVAAARRRLCGCCCLLPAAGVSWRPVDATCLSRVPWSPGRIPSLPCPGFLLSFGPSVLQWLSGN